MEVSRICISYTETHKTVLLNYSITGKSSFQVFYSFYDTSDISKLKRSQEFTETFFLSSTEYVTFIVRLQGWENNFTSF